MCSLHALLRILLTSLLLLAGATGVSVHSGGSTTAALAMVTTRGVHAPSAHIACDTHRTASIEMATHGNTPRCKQACLALSAGFSAVLPMQVPALRLADAASAHPDARHALPAGRVVMPERRPPKAA